MSALLDLLHRQARETVDLADRNAADAGDRMRGDFDDLIEATTAAWLASYGSTRTRPDTVDLRALADRLSGRIAAVYRDAGPRGRASIAGGVGAAIALGVDHARAQVALFQRPPDVTPPDPSADLLDAVGNVDDALDEQQSDALDLLAGAAGYGDVMAALAKARGGAWRLEMAARWITVRSASLGAGAVARAGGFHRVWTAMIDACPICAALSGTVDPDDDPPKHPNCHCEIAMWSLDWAGAEDLPDQVAAFTSTIVDTPDLGPPSDLPAFTPPPSVAATVNRLLRIGA